MDKLKILLPTAVLDIGGAETHVVGLAKQLKQMGHEPIIVSSGGVYVEEIKANNIKHYYSPLNSRKISDIMTSLKVFRLIIQKEKPDLIHTHGRIAALASKLVSLLFKVPFMTTAHAFFHASGIFKYLTFWGKEVIAISDDVKNYLIDQFGVDPNKITVIQNGIDINEFHPSFKEEKILEELQLKPSSKKIVYISRITGPLGDVAKTVINTAPRLNEILGDVEIIIVGDGEQYEEIKIAADKVNQKENLVKVVGKRTDVANIISIADVVVAVSRTALEAMAMEKPVVLAGGEGYMGVLKSTNYTVAKSTNFTGRKIEKLQSEDQLIEDIKSLFQGTTKEELEKMGAFNREKVEEEFSIRKMTEDTINVYKQLLRDRR
ncbi:MAG: glycosyltransferase family 4 protein [Clostridiaceae bacterium]|nr:glycosyltransferase family 4 protein [Clostridiaceae bacterium]